MSQHQDDKLLFGASDRIELVATILLSLAAIFTAWAAFQSAKWSGEQAISFSRAGATRTESARFDTRAGQQVVVDVQVFTAWLGAISTDRDSGRIDITPGVPYSPTEGTVSGFLFNRMREEFRPAMTAWLALWTTDKDKAPPTPFDMEEYVLANALEADRLLSEAQQHTTDALQDNQNSDNYVLTVVAFALVLFFAGVSSKLVIPRNRIMTITVATILFIGATVALFALPIHAIK
jgi:hypothetical protein